MLPWQLSSTRRMTSLRRWRLNIRRLKLKTHSWKLSTTSSMTNTTSTPSLQRPRLMSWTRSSRLRKSSLSTNRKRLIIRDWSTHRDWKWSTSATLSFRGSNVPSLLSLLKWRKSARSCKTSWTINSAVTLWTNWISKWHSKTCDYRRRTLTWSSRWQSANRTICR